MPEMNPMRQFMAGAPPALPRQPNAALQRIGRLERPAAAPAALVLAPARIQRLQRCIPPQHRSAARFAREPAISAIPCKLGGPDTATTVRVRDGQTLLTNGPYGETGEFIADIEVVSCAVRQEAIRLAAAHPIACYHAIEVRPFYSG
jgi:hypothetical protein